MRTNMVGATRSTIPASGLKPAPFLSKAPQATTFPCGALRGRGSRFSVTVFFSCPYCSSALSAFSAWHVLSSLAGCRFRAFIDSAVSGCPSGHFRADCHVPCIEKRGKQTKNPHEPLYLLASRIFACSQI